jgi:replicative DNA helicase
VPTGVADLDALTGGLQPGDLVVIAARPGVGKTGLALALVRHAAGLGHPALFCSIEMGRGELAARLLSAHTGVAGQLIRHGAVNASELRRLGDAVGEFAGLPAWIDDSPAQSVLRIAANARRLKRQRGLALVAVDYLQLVEPEERGVPRHEQVAAASRRLKALARELEVPLVALAQLNRESESRTDRRPRLSDLRESGQVEQDADVVVLLSRVEGRPDAILLDVAKQRNGPTGEAVVRFDRERMRFEEFTPFA